MPPRLAIIGPLVVVLAACGYGTTDQQTAAANPEATANAAVATVGQKNIALPLTAQAFVDAASASNRFEIESARIV